MVMARQPELAATKSTFALRATVDAPSHASRAKAGDSGRVRSGWPSGQRNGPVDHFERRTPERKRGPEILPHWACRRI